MLTTYMHGGGFSRNIVGYIEQVVGRALCDLDIEMPEIENLSYGNDVCDSFGLKGYNFQVFIPNCLPQMHYSYEKNLLLNCEENVGYFGFKADYENDAFDSFDDVDYDLDGIIERIVRFVRECRENEIRRIKELSRLTLTLEWGSPEQVEAENEFFRRAKKAIDSCYRVDEPDSNMLDVYCLKATTVEAVEYTIKTLKARGWWK